MPEVTAVFRDWLLMSPKDSPVGVRVTLRKYVLVKTPLVKVPVKRALSAAAETTVGSQIKSTLLPGKT
jgi:hypothetical protein